MPDYSLSALIEPIGTGGLLALCLVVIGISFVYVSLDTKSTKNDVKPKTKIMSQGLFWIGIALFVCGCVAVVLV